jgi:hypothetical protein
MATDLALALGLPHHEMVQVVKVARLEGLIRKGTGRGTSAAAMNADDAVSILLAAVSDTNPKQLAAVVNGLKRLPLVGTAAPEWQKARSDKRLGQVLAELLEDSPSAALPELELGLNNTKTQGYVIVRTEKATEVFASWPLRNHCGLARPLYMFGIQPPLLRATHVRPEVFAALRASLQKPVPRGRGALDGDWLDPAEPEDEAPAGMRP